MKYDGTVKKIIPDLPKLLKEVAGVRSDSEAALMGLAADEIDGLEEDLRSAVEVAWNRGATEWVKMNYPKDAERLERAALREARR